jgi:hypothetical protein
MATWIGPYPTARRQRSSCEDWRPRRVRRTGSRACRRRCSGRSSTPCWASMSTSTRSNLSSPTCSRERLPAATACSAPGSSKHMELLSLVLQPLDESAARRVESFAEEPCVGDERVQRLRALAEGSVQLAAHDFDRNRYLNGLVIDGRLDGLRRPSSDPDAAHRAWTTPVVGDDVAAGWRSLRPTAIQTRSVATSATSTSCTGSRFRHAGLRATLLASTTGCMSSRLRNRRGRDRSIRLHCPRQRRPRRLRPEPR